jgi:hypothetical protein
VPQEIAESPGAKTTHPAWWGTLRRGILISACRREQSPPRFAAPRREDSNAGNFRGLRSTDDIPVVTRENTPERTLYFLQHRWRLRHYVRTPPGPSEQGLCGG